MLRENATLILVALGSAVLGGVSGALGSFAVLRRQSLIGDAVSHAALPGLVLAFLIFRTKAPLPLLLGAAAVGWLATLAVLGIVRVSRVPYDSALGGVMSVFFGLGVLLFSVMQKRLHDSSQTGLSQILFGGQAATLLLEDVKTIVGMGSVAVVVMLLFWKEFKLLSFDPAFAGSLGWPVRGLDILLTSLLVVGVAIGLQLVGVVLMSAMVVAPAAAARQWTHRLERMVPLAGLIGAACGAAGVFLSTWLSEPGKAVPTGPAIVLCGTVAVIVSLAAGAVRRAAR